MSTSSKDSSIGGRSRTTMQGHDQFIDRHRLDLLRYLDGTTPESAEDPDVLSYIQSVLSEWQEVFGRSELALPSLEERTFWYALYQLEELVEAPGPHIDPFEKLHMENLVEVRELLRHRRPLPQRFMATRPDGT